MAQIDRSGYYAEMAFTLSHTKMPTLLLLFYVPLTLYYKANGLKKLSFYQDEANGAARASIPPGMLMWTLVQTRGFPSTARLPLNQCMGFVFALVKGDSLPVQSH